MRKVINKEMLLNKAEISRKSNEEIRTRLTGKKICQSRVRFLFAFIRNNSVSYENTYVTNENKVD